MIISRDKVKSICVASNRFKFQLDDHAS